MIACYPECENIVKEKRRSSAGTEHDSRKEDDRHAHAHSCLQNCYGHCLQLLLGLLLRCITLRPTWELLARHHLEPSVSAKDLLDEVRDASRIALELSILAVVQGRESQALVRVED